MTGNPEVMWHVPRGERLCTTCVQEGGFEGPKNGPKQRRINNRLLSYRPKSKNTLKYYQAHEVGHNCNLSAACLRRTNRLLLHEADVWRRRASVRRFCDCAIL